ncbi:MULTISPECIES: hypothetical protein [Paenibacillus]|uniref:Apea-like HEPN domain-containing protein n=1 Tax=Paenibacillus illinoisensis TaxID=59845 RepID=A0A2W0CH56_9BACL|nr:hypothetical protein [Paenibacillus illinoisensis]PYY27178.1 Uncharacterized protein PIL02S_04677 [Paenibacillus illinoisensis]
MIKFVMINKKNNQFNFYTYTNEIMNKLQIELGSNGLEFYLNKEIIRKATFEYKHTEFLINFTVVATSETFQLKVDINLPTKDVSSLELHDVKIKIKDLMIGDWEQCVWLEDSQSELFAEELYKKVHNVENSLRRLINSILFFKLGGDWWGKYMPVDLINKYNLRNDQYRRRTPSFDNIHTNLMSIDTADLILILSYKTHKLRKDSIFRDEDINPFEGFAEPENALSHEEKKKLVHFQDTMNSILFNSKSMDKLHLNLIQVLKDQMEIDKDFWEDYFCPWFSCDFRKFSGLWQEFTADRNHVAHNKLIDVKLSDKFHKSMTELQKLISEAEGKFATYTESEAANYLEEIKVEAKEIERQHALDWREQVEADAGINILDDIEIIEQYQEYITDALNEIKDNFYYRTDIEIIYSEPDLKEECEILVIKHNLIGNELKVRVFPNIDSSEGETSTVTLQVISKGFKGTFRLHYTNGEAVYNSEQTTYMPLV